jgi:hypothetical protein
MNMGNETNITEKLKKMVKQRKTPIIENKRIVGHRPHRSTKGNLSSESYSFTMDE